MKNNNVLKFIAITVLLTIISIGSTFILNESGWAIYGWISSILGILCVFYAARKSILTFYIGVPAVVSYAMVSLHAEYIYDFLLNMYFLLPVQVIGYYIWKKHLADDSHVSVAKLKNGFTIAIITLISIGLLSTILYDPISVALLQKESDITGIYRFMDAATTVLTVVAQFLMIKRYSIQWPVWIIINIMAVFMWLDLSSPAQVVMWSVYLLNSFYGMYAWRK